MSVALTFADYALLNILLSACLGVFEIHWSVSTESGEWLRLHKIPEQLGQKSSCQYCPAREERCVVSLMHSGVCVLWDSGTLEKLFPLERCAFHFTVPSSSMPAISCEEVWLLTFLLLSLIIFIISWQVFLHPHNKGGTVPCAVILVLVGTCCSCCRVTSF